MNIKQKECTISCIWYACVFVFMYVWFSYIHPLIVFDADDWTYISYIREAIPLWKNWNPTRILPETLMPLVSSIGVWFLMPLHIDYISAITIVSAVVVSTLVVIYVYLFGKLIERLFHFSRLTLLYVEILFLLCHFLIFRSELSDNRCLLLVRSLTCHYFYFIPSLLNASLVLLFIHNDHLESFLLSGSSALKGLLFLAVYLAIFSNLVDSGILAAYAGSRILIGVISENKDRVGFRRFICNNAIYLLILLLWIVSAVYELSGGRAQMVGSGFDATASFMYEIKQTLMVLFQAIHSMSITFKVMAIVIVLFALLSIFLESRKEKKIPILASEFSIILTALAAVIVYTVILCAKVNSGYIFTTEYLFGICFYLLLLVVISMSYLIKRFEKLVLILPVGLLVLFFQINTSGNTFSFYEGVSAKSQRQFSSTVIDEAVRCEQENQSEMNLFVPVFDSADNWPLTTWMGDRIAETLYEHGITKTKLKISIIPTEELN